MGETIARSFDVLNTGNVKLPNFSFALEGTNGENYDVDVPDGFSVSPDDTETLTVQFHPVHEGTLPSSFTVSHKAISNATKCPSFTVFVRGEGFEPIEVDAGFPDAGPHDAGPIDAGFDAGAVELPDGGVALEPEDEWFSYGAMEDARIDFAAVKTADGMVLVIGGSGENGEALDTIERFDPETGRSRIVAHMAVGRIAPGAAVLGNGQVAIAGGRNTGLGGFALTSVEVFDPTDDTLACPPPQDGCGLNRLDVGALAPDGRIGPFVAAAGTNLVVGLGRTLDVDDNEVPLAGGVRLSVAADNSNIGALAPLTGAALDARLAETHVVSPGGASAGDVLLIGGKVSATGARLNVVQRVDVSAGDVADLGTLANARSYPAAALLSNGDVIVASGANASGAGIGTVERIVDAFGNASVETVDVTLTPRVGGTLAALPDDVLVYAGGAARDMDGAPTAQSLVPLATADVLVPFNGSFLRLAPDNGLAHGRLKHQALVVGADSDEVLFLGGTSATPRPAAHPHAERFVILENRFITYGLMGPGTALEAGLISLDSNASLVSAGGVDPHTGRVSAAVRGFDASADTGGRFVEAAPMNAPRRDHTLTRLDITDAQCLLVAGGRDESGQVLASLSILDPVNGTDRPLPVQLLQPRANHTATRLAPDNPIAPGAVLLCGGVSTGGAPLDTCEVVIPPPEPLNPDTYVDADVLPVTGRLSAGRVAHSATLLDTGEVLLLGGGDIVIDQVNADLFIPDEDAPSLRETGLPNLPRRNHAAVLLGSGRVLVVGGEAFDGAVAVTRKAELYVRANEQFVALPDMEETRVAPAAFLLVDGNVLISGGAKLGNDDDNELPTLSVRSSELYIAGPDGVGTFEDFAASANKVELSYGRSDIAFVDVFGRAIVAGGTHRDGVLGTGDERRTPVTFVDFLQNPDDALGPGD